MAVPHIGGAADLAARRAWRLPRSGPAFAPTRRERVRGRRGAVGGRGVSASGGGLLREELGRTMGRRGKR